MKPLPRKLLVAALAGALTWALVEGGARVALGVLPEERAPLQLGDEGEWDELGRQLYRADDELFFRLRPGLTLERTENPRIFDVRTNSLGLRGRETTREKPACLPTRTSTTWAAQAGAAAVIQTATTPTSSRRALGATPRCFVVVRLNSMAFAPFAKSSAHPLTG